MSAVRSPLSPVDAQGVALPVLGATAAGLPVYSSYRPSIKSLSNELELMHGDAADCNRYIPVPADPKIFEDFFKNFHQVASPLRDPRVMISCISSFRIRFVDVSDGRSVT